MRTSERAGSARVRKWVDRIWPAQRPHPVLARMRTNWHWSWIIGGTRWAANDHVLLLTAMSIAVDSG
jgi:hypothetical protein